jgi:sugar transferase (PEP-CTERM/EpsH1 system associated)
MRVAFVAARLPWPPHFGGALRTFHLLREAGTACQVTLITATELASPAERAAAVAALEAALPGVVIRAVPVPPRNQPVRRALRVLGNTVDRQPFTWAGYRHPAFRAHLDSALAEAPFDLVHCDHIAIAGTVLASGARPLVLNAHNVESVLFTRMATTHPSPGYSLMARWQAGKVRRAEQAVFTAFDRVLATSAADAREVARLSPLTPVSVVPNGVDVDAYRPEERPPSGARMVFVGALDWIPNIDAVVLFAEQVLPRIRRARPDVAFSVVGRDPSPRIRERLRPLGVEFTGTVPDVRPYVREAALVVVPLRIGSGTRLKILEAWAMGKAVLSTSLGAEGLPAEDGANIALADTPDALAARALALLADPEVLRRLGRAGRHTVETAFSWELVGHELLRAYRDTAGQPRLARGSVRCS